MGEAVLPAPWIAYLDDNNTMKATSNKMYYNDR